MPSHSRASLPVVVILLVALGGFLFYAINELTGEIATKSSNATEVSGPTMSLHDAAARGDVQALEREFARGANANAAISGGEAWQAGMTPLMSAAFSGKRDAVARVLQAGGKADMRSTDGKTALFFAAGWADASTVKTLLDAGARLDARTDDGLTATMIAAARGKAETLKALADAGANVSFANKWGETALLMAARAGDAEKVRILLTAGAQPDVRDNTGATPLWVACSSGAPIDVIKALLDAHADVKIADNDGVTPLMRAADRGDAELVKILLAGGAPKEAKDHRGWTAEAWADSRDDEIGKAIVKLLNPSAK
jgi:ankyrin repeat protein